ncbi:CU044_5270 family protein [Streptomyces sp. BI20]|uniref:CU044_5270 family protein n=1 Tax=Streptomyces sp. BI20 TaxID=3403460 RepID=UPI003C717ACD
MRRFTGEVPSVPEGGGERELLAVVADERLAFAGRERVGEFLAREALASGREGSARGRWGGRGWVVSLGSAVAVCAVTVAVVLGRGAAGPPEEGRIDAAVVRFLDRAALAAGSRPAEAAGAGRFVYVRTVGHSSSLSERPDGTMELGRTDQSAERWIPADGSAPTLVRTPGGGTSEEPFAPGPPSLGAPTPAYLAGLTEDPDELLGLLRAEAERAHGPGSDSTLGVDQAVFVAVGDLLGGGRASARTSATLYRVATRLPGVVLVPGVVDAAGRPGVAVAREHGGERREWIFDAGSLAYLGTRTVLLRASAWGAAGAEVESTAVVARRVTDRAGVVPEG